LAGREHLAAVFSGLLDQLEHVLPGARVRILPLEMKLRLGGIAVVAPILDARAVSHMILWPERTWILPESGQFEDVVLGAGEALALPST
jgi:hypothetical protein